MIQEFVENLFVVPAKAGTQFCLEKQQNWIPAFAGMTA